MQLVFALPIKIGCACFRALDRRFLAQSLWGDAKFDFMMMTPSLRHIMTKAWWWSMLTEL